MPKNYKCFIIIKGIFSTQVFLKPRDGNLVPLLPVVSSLIKDKRAHPDLNIVDISDDSSPVEGMYRQSIHSILSKHRQNRDSI